MIPENEIVLGAQYYRPPNPPREAWARDLERMADSGMNTVKFWACWSWMNPERDRFDFEDLDVLIDLADRSNLKVVLNVILEDAPYWLEESHPAARYRDAEGHDISLGGAMNTPGGGWPGLCFDNEPVAEAGLAFLDAVVRRYKDHPAILAWDVWNEPHLEPASYFPDRLFCYCRGSIAGFQRWLKARYPTLEALNARWARRFSAWSQVRPPRLFEAVPDMLDWREYWFERLRAGLDARVARAKACGAKQPVMTHVALSGFTGQMATHTLDEWTLAPAVDGFGTSSFPTWLMADDPVEHLMNLDTARAAAAGRPFWQTELQGGRGRRAGTASTPHPRPQVVVLEMWNARAAGARGILFWQWRPELLGPESPGYGLCAVDGGPTARSRAAAEFARMVRRVPALAGSAPVPASVGLLVSRRTAIHAFATDRTMDIYRRSVMGAYRLLVDADLTVEFVHEDDVMRRGVPKHLQMAYFPMPAVVSEALADRLVEWVEGGGRLVSEAAPGEFDERGWHRDQVPPPALRRLFAVRSIETDAVAGEIAFTLGSARAAGAWMRDEIEPSGADVFGTFDDGLPAATRHPAGRGEAILICTCPSVAYDGSRDAATRAAIASLLRVEPPVTVARWVDPAPGLMLRPHVTRGGAQLVFALNWTGRPQVLEVDRAAEIHETAGSRRLAPGERTEIPAMAGAAIEANLLGSGLANARQMRARKT
jgi:beta-galactosidase